MQSPSPNAAAEPPTKKLKTDGSLDSVDQSIVIAARNHEAWIAERRKKWPSKERIAEKLAEEAAKPREQPPQATATDKEAGPQSASKQNHPRRIVCRFFLRGRCTAGSNCRFLHEKIEREPRPAHERVYKRFEPPAKTSLFVRLLQSDHDAEDEKLLEFIEYLYKKGPFKDIKL